MNFRLYPAVFLLAFPILLLSMHTHKANADEIIYFDGEFLDTDWTATEIHDFAADTEIARVSTSGNPGANLRIQNIGNSGNSYTRFFYRSENAIYDPSVQGTIDEIEYSEDSRFIANSGGTTGRIQGYGLALWQAGNIYQADGGYTNSSDNWEQQLNTFTSSDFFLIRLDGTSSSLFAPDFTATGDSISFGFWRANSAGGSSQYSMTSAIDNWQVHINPTAVPEPSSMLLLGVASVFAVGRRRRAKSHSHLISDGRPASGRAMR